MEFQTALQVIKDNSVQSKDNDKFLVQTNWGLYLLRVWSDNGTLIDGCQYKRMIKYPQGYSPEFLWSLSTPSKFVDVYLSESPALSIISSRKYGEPKLSKPPVLKGIKPVSIDFIPSKCKFQCYAKDGTAYIFCNDFFSPVFCPPAEDRGKPLSYIIEKYFGTTRSFKNFVYPDSWGSVVLRSQAYISISNIFSFITVYSKATEQIDAFYNFVRNEFIKFGYVIPADDYYWRFFCEKFLEWIKTLKKSETPS